MLATFDDYIQQNPHCRKFENDDDMHNVFEFLSREYILLQMLAASDAGKPAIAPVAENIEHFFIDSSKAHDNSLDDNFTRQAIGLMAKTILAPFGYVVWKQKDLPKGSRATKFQSASTYRFDPAAPRTMRVIRRIEQIDTPIL